ncbi:MAG: adenylate/guanylate cyclase domain-containing protein [Pseudomonadota bacterium]
MKWLRRLTSGAGISRLGALIALLGLLLVRVADPTPVEMARAQSFDLYQRLKPRVYTPQPVAIVDIDEASIQQLGQWPWPRTRMAELVDRMKALGAAAVAFDIVFAEEDRLSPEQIALDNTELSDEIRDQLKALPSNDDRFAASIATSRIIMGQTSVRSLRDLAGKEPMEVPDVPHAFLGEDPKAYLPNYPALVQNRPELEKAAIGRGVFTVKPDADGVFRQVPMLFRIDDKFRLSLSAELLRVATGAKAFAVISDSAGVKGIRIGRVLVPTTSTATVWPYFTPTVPSRFVSVRDIMNGTVNPNRLRGHLVLVGTSAIGLEDFRATPMASLMAGVEIHAQVIENILTNQMLVRPNYSLGLELAAILFPALLAIILVPMLGATLAFVCAVVLLGTYIGLSYLAFDWYRLLIDPVYPTISVGLIFIILATFNYLREERQRAQIRSAFGQYVSPDFVKELADNPEALQLGGETRELSVLFSDVRGFTSISESYKENPQGLTELMNLFLTVLSQAILRYGGTIDKFMGDAVMAFWNAPITNEKHALAACHAAINMIKDVEALNKQFRTEYEEKVNAGEEDAIFHEINVGIGINSGTCVVGNMGSEDRFDYTALGDTVNLASRLEGQSKPYGIKIILGQETAFQIQDDMATLEIDRIRVKGKNEPETIFALIGDETMLADKRYQELNRQNALMLQKYREQDWETAAALLEILAEQAEEIGVDIEGFLFIYEARLAEFQANPPGRDWDGVYTAESK